ncbi:MAG TPA: hypothetical protein VF062_16370, partial [Candidatus Limnocylindrales bacterium]
LSALGEKAAPLGEFPEAFSLGGRHRRTAQDMAVLMESVQEALGFAAGITRAVATSYAEYDEQAAAMLRQGAGIGVPLTPGQSIVAPVPSVPPPVLPPPPVAGGGGVYYSSQYRPSRTPDQPNAN